MPASRRPSVFMILFFAVWGCGFLAGGVFAMVTAYQDYRLATAAVEGVCTVTGISITESTDDDGNVSYSPSIDYSLEVDNKPFTDVDSPGHYDGSRASAQAAADQHSVGQRLPCWYDPANPENSALSDDQTAGGAIAMALFGLLFMAIPIGVWARGLRNWGKSKELLERRYLLPSQPHRATRQRIAGGYRASPPRSDLLGGYGPIEHLPLPELKTKRGRELPIQLRSGELDRSRSGLLLGAIVWNVFSWFCFIGTLLIGEGGAWLLVPFVLVGVWLGWLGLKPYTQALRKVPAVEIEREPLQPGQTVKLSLVQPGPAKINSYCIKLVCTEWVRYQRGTNTYTDTHTVYESSLVDESSFDVAPHQPWHASVDLTIPDDAMHTFAADDNRILWHIAVTADIDSFPDLKETYELRVIPPAPGS